MSSHTPGKYLCNNKQYIMCLIGPQSCVWQGLNITSRVKLNVTEKLNTHIHYYLTKLYFGGTCGTFIDQCVCYKLRKYIINGRLFPTLSIDFLGPHNVVCVGIIKKVFFVQIEVFVCITFSKNNLIRFATFDIR